MQHFITALVPANCICADSFRNSYQTYDYTPGACISSTKERDDRQNPRPYQIHHDRCLKNDILLVIYRWKLGAHTNPSPISRRWLSDNTTTCTAQYRSKAFVQSYHFDLIPPLMAARL